MTEDRRAGDDVADEFRAGGSRDGGDGNGVRWLMIAEEAFLPADSGGRVESLNLLRAAAQAGISLHVLVPGLDTAKEIEEHRAALPGARLDPILRRTGPLSHLSLSPYLFVSRPLPTELVAGLGRDHAREPYTAVVAVSFRVAHLGIAVADGLDLPLLVRPHNIESQYFRQFADGVRPPRNLPYLAEAWKLRRAERAVHASRRVTLYADIADGDATARALRTSTPVIHVPPFLPAPPPGSTPADAGASPREPGSGVVLFLGALDNANNQGGIGWFTQECWPGLHRSHPGAELHVVGRRATAELRDSLVAAGARVTVDAPEVASHLAAADVFVNPVRRGAGINIKMVEAMAAGLPVVSTEVGARGLHWRNGEHLIVADDPGEFRAAVAALLDDPGRRGELAAAGMRFVRTELDGVAQIRRLVAILNGSSRSGSGA